MNKRTTQLCLECNGPVPPSNRLDKKFCCHEHGIKYNNRRKSRGQEAYDILMAMRFDRKAASEQGAWAILCRMASEWKAEDDEAGIRSFQPISEVLMRKPQYRGIKGRVSR